MGHAPCLRIEHARCAEGDRGSSGCRLHPKLASRRGVDSATNILAMFALLVKTRLLGLWNVVRYSASRSPLLSFGLTLLGMLLFASVYVGFRLFLSLSNGPHATNELIYEIFHFLFLF